MRALWLSNVWPDPPVSGGRIRSRQTLEALASLADHVTVIASADPGTDAGPLRRALPNVEVLDPIPWAVSIRRQPRALARALTTAVATGQPYRTAKYDSRKLAAKAAHLLAGRDLLYVNYLGAAAVVRRLGALGVSLPPIVYEAHNVEHQIARDVAAGLTGLRIVASPLLQLEASRIQAAEADLVRRAGCVVAITNTDTEAMRALGARAAVEVPPGAWPIVGRDQLGTDVLVLGNFGWTPTAQALAALLPSLSHLPPDANRIVAGGGASPRLRRAMEIAGLRYLGFVENLEPLWHDARVVVIPGAGTGARIRFLEAFRRGLPVVATRDSARGIEVGEAALLIDHPTQVANSVERVLGDDALAYRMSAAGVRLAVGRHSRQAVQKAMAEALAFATQRVSVR